MKKMLIVLTLASTMLFGQMGLSAYGGLNMANLVCEGCEGDMKMGGAFGVNYTMSPVVLGAGVSMRGSSESMTMDDDIDGEVTVTMNFMYLDLSVLYPIAAGPGNAWVGLDVGMNLSATSDMEVTGEACDLYETMDMACSSSDDIEDVEMDYGLAFGYTYPVNEQIGIYASYYMGLADIVKDVETKHTGIGLGMTYALPF